MSFLKNMKIGKRLGYGFTVILILSMSITALAIWQLRTVAATTRHLLESPLAKERLIADWYVNLSNGIVRAMAIAKSSDPALVEFFAVDAKKGADESLALKKKIESMLIADEEKALFKRTEEERAVYLSSRSKMNALKAAGKQEESNRVFTESFMPVAQKYAASVREFVDMQRQYLDMTAKNTSAANYASQKVIVTIAAIVLLLGILFAWWITTSITRPLRRAVDATNRVAKGDLTGRIEADAQDETGQLLHALKTMNGNLLKTVGEVRAGTHSIATASSQIAAGNVDLSSRTEEQASSLTETASAMEQLTNTVKQNADNAEQANKLAASASDIASKGGDVVAQVVETMHTIHSSASQIENIITVIDGIAFQTNILALNAAVEAARAGEQGKGFAVVASEVRSLAQRSAAAAKDVKALIDASVATVNTGSSLAKQAGATMQEVVDSVNRVTGIVAEITVASQEQSVGIEQVNQAIVQMDQVTQQNAALVEEAAAATASLQDQASSLTQAVAAFNVGEAQTAAAPAAPSRAPAPSRISAPSRAPAPVRSPAPRRLAVATAQTAQADDDWQEF